MYDQKCSRIVPDAIRAAGGTPVIEQSGTLLLKKLFWFIKLLMLAKLLVTIFSAQSGDDGMVAALFFCRLLAQNHKRLLNGCPPSLRIHVTPDIRIPMEPQLIQPLLQKIGSESGDFSSVDHRDGLRFEFPESWCLIRPSVTEPMITARFEGINPIALKELIARVCNAAPELD